MTRTRILAVLLTGAIGAAAALATGHAASLPVDSATLDSFAANQLAPTTVPSDSTAPSLVAGGLQMFDTNANGRIDQVTATFNEALQASTSTAGWSLANTPSGGTLSSVLVTGGGTTATLTIGEGAGAANTQGTGFTVALALASSDIKDAAGNKASFAATGPADKAPPVAMTAEYFDSGTPNGKIDQIKVTYSETVAATVATAPWSIAGGPTGLATTDLSTVSSAGAVITLNFSETNGTATETTTVAPTLTVSLDNVGQHVMDGAVPANVAANLTNRATADKAAPVFLNFADSDTTTGNGRIEDDDWIEFDFSEPINLTTTIDPADVAMDDPSGPGEDRLSIEGLFTITALGSDGYISGNNKTASFLDSDLSLVSSNKTIHVELSSCTGTGCASDRLASSGPVTLTILASVKGTDGLPVTGSVAKTGYGMF